MRPKGRLLLQGHYWPDEDGTQRSASLARDLATEGGRIVEMISVGYAGS